MGDLALEITTEDLGYVCDEPNCELAGGPLGLTAAEIQARVLALRAKPSAPADGEPEDDELDAAEDLEDGEEEEEEADSDEEAADDPADPTAIDPLGQGAPCPLCRAAQPRRRGKLLAIPNRGVYARVLAAATGLFGLRYWQLVESDSTTGTNRLLDAQRHALGDATKSKATSSFVIGRKLITAVVLKELPFDGHLLRFGNRDAAIHTFTTVPGKKGQKPRQKRAWVQGEAKYGLGHALPGPTARANPVYVRELQEDLIWLGYLSTSRGTVTPGEFDVFTLGAVLGFKQDLIEVYGIATSDKRLAVTPGSVRAGEFSTAIWTQPKFFSPVRIMLDWMTALRGGGKRKGVLAVATALVKNVQNNLAKTKTAKKFLAYLGRFEHHRTTLGALLEGWPHLAALEAVDRLFMPFAPKAATKAVGELTPVPPGKQPKHADASALADDAVWSSEGYNARELNRGFFLADLNKALEAVKRTLASIDDLRGRMAALSPPAEAAADWTAARAAAERTLTTLTTLLGLVRYWILDSPTQVTAWLAHIVEMGTVDQPTAVYLKALREGGKIGPGRRPAYQLQRLTSKDDFATPDELATFLRDECTKRTPNSPGAKSTTMPEIVALQFFGNETGLKFTHSLAPFNTRAEDKDTRLVMLGVDTNSYRKGSFDAVFHAGGDWFSSRGWGVGQATEANGTLDGLQMRRGLPILPPGADAVQHPRAYVDCKTSITDAMSRKVLAKYNRTLRRDCTFGTVPDGYYYDCHSCLKRFFDADLRGVGKYGKGGAFVPKNETTLGNPDNSEGFFLDLERYTPFARGKDGVEDPDAARQLSGNAVMDRGRDTQADR